ncbi:hypothetical protein CPHO_02880 [Corynebacterium phocae]|uniref:site-specific DNA-methyltransferase (adenine-specific) n=1 Tax=Corynebacterium phocae TaxID=161895 RepID=A0A1L7D657_9CORY|nr:DNA adenine methylase [Corynebacterium phocae]APT93624.1 hypothetical protein CPHO_02880 [Corynebacterium phocae]KAA8726392.1 DNA adenine methylase [Corynebacterium phocae]
MQGSKRRQAPIIERLFPTRVSEVIEPFCGSAAVSLHLLASGFSGPVHINDKNGDIAALWEKIISHPEELAAEYKDIWLAQFTGDYGELSPREYFSLVRSRFNAAGERRPADFLFILNRIVKASLRYNQKGEVNQSADGRRRGARPDATAQRIMESSRLMQRAQVTSLDWLDCVAGADASAFIYLDPPYQGTTDTADKRYIEGLAYESFREGVHQLIRAGASALISYDAVQGPVSYGTPLHHDLDLLPIDVVTGVSSQATLLGRMQQAHETLYLTPALVDRLGGQESVSSKFAPENLAVPA